MRKRHLGLVTLVVLLAAMGGVSLWVGWTSRLRLPVINFHGLVVDDVGTPLGGVVVTVRIITADPPAPAQAKGKWLKLKTDAAGRFQISGERGLSLHVHMVDKSGYEWLRDWADGPTYQVRREVVGNQAFIFHDAFGPVYMPDPTRPVVFSLYPKGSEVPNKITRGGADRYPDGSVVVNEPCPPVLPSVGPGAPKTVPEKDAALRAMWEALDRSIATRPADVGR